jgi:hypothetical protein
MSEEEIQKSVKLQREIFSIVKSSNDDEKLDG